LPNVTTMKLVNIIPPPTRPEAERVAEELLAGLNAELARRVEHHAAGFSLFWDSEATPDAIAEALGENGKLFLDLSKENLRNIANIAAMVEKTLDDAIAPAHYQSRRPLTLDGNRIVIAPPAAGQDAWGRPLPPAAQPE
jgi:hypothetical protein